MWQWRRIAKTTYTERKTKQKYLKKQRTVIETIKKRQNKLTVYGHNNSLKNALEENIVGEIGRWKPQKKIIDDVMQILSGPSCREMKRIAVYKEDWLVA